MALCSLRREHDQVDVEIDALRSERCNPCFVALVQAAQLLPQVTLWRVRLRGRPDPVIELPTSVLHLQFPLFCFAAYRFPHSLPQTTFLPCLVYTRLKLESADDAGRAGGWMVLNEGQHAINDMCSGVDDAATFGEKLSLAGYAAGVAEQLLPSTSGAPLRQAARTLESVGAALRDPSTSRVGWEINLDRVMRIRDRLCDPVAVLPTLDPTPLVEVDNPHEVH
jgi:hypothetical protein